MILEYIEIFTTVAVALAPLIVPVFSVFLILRLFSSLLFKD